MANTADVISAIIVRHVVGTLKSEIRIRNDIAANTLMRYTMLKVGTTDLPS